MCGIFGFVLPQPDHTFDPAYLHQMGDLVSHRGPDDYGDYFNPPVGLGVRRLSIIDLQTGQQPISNEDRTLWLIFNGEIYNYRTLQAALQQQGHVFRSKSDSEVIVHAYESYGPACVEYFNGMFAFVIWDERGQRLFMARDRLGIKPLYYFWQPGHPLIFGSELKSIIAHPNVPRRLNLTALDHLLTLEYIPAPYTIFENIYKLPAGYHLTYQDGDISVRQYWEIPHRPTPPDLESCIEELIPLIEDAVRLRLVSDVPLGAFLSGGIDSSTIVAFMSRAMDRPVQTFSIGFEEASYNELPQARAVAAHFKTDHHDEILRPDIAGLAEQLVGHLDEPLGDFSIFPTYLVSKLARNFVKVVLSGDGGDEIFGGYDTYVAQQVAQLYRYVPGPLRQQTLPAILDRIPPQATKKGLINKAKRFVEGAALPENLQHTRWMMFMSDQAKQALYQPDFAFALDGQNASATLLNHFKRGQQFPEPLLQQQFVDIKTYLAENILTKVDRMSMAASLEARVPLLDHRIVEFAVNLPAGLKLQGNRTKVILREAMKSRLPDLVIHKPKQGFSIPLKQWMNGPLAPLMKDLLSEASIGRHGLFQTGTVNRWMGEHEQGRFNHSHRLWALMVFELWHRKVLT